MDKSSKPSESHASKNNPADSFFNQLGPLLNLTSIFFFNFASRITPAPLIPRIEIDLSLSHADAGTLFFMISLGYFITLIGSGFVSSHFNHKCTIVISNTALGLALIGTSFCSGLWTIRLGLFAVGMAAGLYLPSAIASLTALIPSRHWGKALAIHDIAPNLSFVAVPLICEAALVWFSWRTVFLLSGFGALVMSPVFIGYSRGGEFQGESPSFVSFRQLFGNLSVWVMVLLFSLAIISTMGIYTMLPLYLVSEYGMDANLANTLISLSRIPSIIIVFFGGWATDRIGPWRMIKIVLLFTGLMTFLMGIASPSLISYIIFLQPLMAACFFPAGFAAMSIMVPAQLRNVAVSLIIPLTIVVGGGLAPVFIGFISDMGSFGLAFIICGILITAGSFFTGVFKLYDQQT